MKKTWWIGAVLAAIFTLLGVGLLAGSVAASGEARVVLLFAGGFVLLLGLGMGWAIPGVKRQQEIGGDEETMRVVEPRPAGEASQPWTEEQLAGDVAHRLDGAPYVVLHAPGRIRVRADLADARFLGPVGARGVKEVRTHDVVSTRPAEAAVVDQRLSVEWSAGVDGALRPRVGGSMTLESGQRFEVGFRQEYGVGADGSAGAQVDWNFDIREMQQPVREALEAAGWKRTWSAEGRLGLAVVIATVGAMVIGGLVVLALQLLG